MDQILTTYKQFIDEYKTDESYQSIKKQPKNISKSIVNLITKINQQQTTLQEVMYQHIMKEGYVMTNVIGDRIYEGSILAIENEEEKDKQEMIRIVKHHFEKHVDDPENTVVGNYASDKIIQILKNHNEIIGIKAGIIDVNLKHEQRRKLTSNFTKHCAFESWKILRRGTIVLYEMENKEYQYARVSSDYRITNEVMDISLYITADETKMISVPWTKLLIVPSDVVDSESFGGSLNAICKDCSEVMMRKIIEEMNNFMIAKINEDFKIDISFVNKKDVLTRKHVKKIKMIQEALKALNDNVLGDFHDEITETLRLKLSAMVDLIRRNVVPTYVVFQSRPKREIIMGVDYLNWSKSKLSQIIKSIDKLIKSLNKEKDSIVTGVLTKEMREWEKRILTDKSIELLSLNGFDESIQLDNTANIEGVLYNKFIIEEVLANVNEPFIKKDIDIFCNVFLETLTNYMAKLRYTAISIAKIDDRNLTNQQVISQLNTYVSMNGNEMNLEFIINEMLRVNEYLLASETQLIESEGKKTVFEVFVDAIKEINSQYTECIDQNVNAIKKFNEEYIIERRQEMDGGLSLAPHIRMQRWLRRKQMKQ